MQNKDEINPPDVSDNGTNKVHLLPDLPTTDDAFGPHRDLAKAIAELVVSEDGGKAIALEGGWGSGKSSVVLMLKTQLEGDDPESASTRVHVFDAWSHEGDPLRRVFLERLTRVCTSDLDTKAKKRWEDRQKKEITGRMRETDQTTTPILKSRWPILFLAILAAYPVAIVALSRFFGEDMNSWVLLLIVVAVVIALLPMLLLVGLFFYSWSETEKKLKKAGRLIALWSKKMMRLPQQRPMRTLDQPQSNFKHTFPIFSANILRTPKSGWSSSSTILIEFPSQQLVNSGSRCAYLRIAVRIVTLIGPRESGSLFLMIHLPYAVSGMMLRN